MNRPFAPEFIFRALLVILPHIGVTLSVAIAACLLSVAGGLALARGMIGGCTSGMPSSSVRTLPINTCRRIGAAIAQGYVALVRCMPSIVMLFLVFYGVPKAAMVWFGSDINFAPKILFVVTALSLMYAATLAEIFRAAYLSVPPSQYQAALCLGLTPRQAVVHVVGPQALLVALPNLGNSFIALLKEGSLAYTIGLIDMMGAGNLVISRNYGARALETYIALAAVYWALTAAAEKAFALLESRLCVGA